jgi:hypothetical protein
VAEQLLWWTGMKKLTVFIAPILIAGMALGGDLTLKPETLRAWDEYVKAASARTQARLEPGTPYLWIDEPPERRTKVRGGEILASPASQQTPKKVPSGLIHDWIGATFIPNTTLEDVIAVVRDYPDYKKHYTPIVLDSKTISLGSQPGTQEDRFSILLMNKSIVLKTAIDGDYKSSTYRVDRHRAYAITQSTRIREVDNYGSPDAKTLPEDQGNGLIWRLFSISRYEERDGGVYVEIEAMALSRDIPFALRWFVEPMVRRISRSSLTTSLQQTQEAVRSSEVLAQHGSGPLSHGPTSERTLSPSHLN